MSTYTVAVDALPNTSSANAFSQLLFVASMAFAGVAVVWQAAYARRRRQYRRGFAGGHRIAEGRVLAAQTLTSSGPCVRRHRKGGGVWPAASTAVA